MKQIYFALALSSLVFVSLADAQCDKVPTEWKRPEECCKFNLIKETVFDSCKSEKQGPRGDKKPPQKGGPHLPPEGMKGSCHVECVFNKTGLYDGKQLVENQIRKVFTAAVNGNEELTTTVNAALDTCLPITKSHSTEFEAALTKGEKCSPVTMFLFMCVTTKMMATCPAADFQSKDAKCVALQKYFNQCPNGPQ